MLTGIAHVAFRIKDMDKALEFYCGVLGFKHVFTMHFEDGTPRLLYLKAGEGQFIELFFGAQKEAYPPERDRKGFYHFCIATDDAAADYERIKATGYPVSTPLKVGDDKNLQFWVSDPEGNAIEFMQLCPGSPQYDA